MDAMACLEMAQDTVGWDCDIIQIGSDAPKIMRTRET
jgi:hypothetical protein